MFLYKHTETIEYVKKKHTFKEKWKITRQFLGLRMQNFQGIPFYKHKHIGRFSNLH